VITMAVIVIIVRDACEILPRVTKVKARVTLMIPG
jgi:hypothetical protein